LAAEEKLRGGIIMPDTAKKKQEQAEVIAIGTGKKDKNGNLIPFPVKVGDIILMEKYSGQEVTVNEEELVILRADDLIAIVEK
jgi:chaperonin GroES